jgi:hypothetical protein
MSALIGALRVSLSAETAQFEAGMKRAQRTAATTRSQFQKSFGGLGNIVKGGLAGIVSGLSLGMLIQGTKAALEYAGSLGEISQQLGVTTRDLQVFRYAATQTGVSQEEMEKGLGRLTKAMGQAQVGSKSMTAAFNSIGISVDDIRSKDAGEVFRLMSDGLAKIPNAADRAAVETAIFGRAGQKLDTLLAGGAGVIDDYAKSLEDLGGILSDEEIQSADLTADKIEELNTQLKTNIAGAVARNSGAILDLANSLIFLVSKLGKALTAWTDFKNALDAQAFDIASKNPLLSAKKRAEGAERAARARGKISDSGVGWNVAGSKVIIDLPPVNAPSPKPEGPGIDKFLQGGGGGGRDKKDDAERKRLEDLRNAFQFDQDILRAQMDVLRAQQQLATDYSDRAALSIQMLNLEQQGFEREMQYAVASGELSKAQAAQLEAEFAKKDALERSAVLLEEEERRREDYNMLDAKSADIQLDILEKQADLADTWQERRAIEHKILDLAYEEERRRLTRIVQESKDWAEIEAARRDLLALTQKQGLDRQSVNRNTMGPLESAQFQFGDLSEEMEMLKVNGIMGAADALTALTGGFGDFKDAAISAIRQVIAEFIRLQTIKMLFNLIGGATGGGFNMGSFMGTVGSNSAALGAIPMNIPGFATGGGFNIMGNRGIDKNVLQLNGLPIARVSHGERVSVSNDSQRAGGGNTFHFAFSGPVTRETQTQVAAAARRGIAQANRKGV